MFILKKWLAPGLKRAQLMIRKQKYRKTLSVYTGLVSNWWFYVSLYWQKSNIYIYIYIYINIKRTVKAILIKLNKE